MTVISSLIIFLVKRLLYVITLFHVISAFFPNKVLLCSTLNNYVISPNRRKNARLGSYDRFNRNLLNYGRMILFPMLPSERSLDDDDVWRLKNYFFFVKLMNHTMTYCFCSCWTIIKVDQWCEDVHGQPDNGDQVGGQPHGHQAHYKVPPEKHTKNVFCDSDFTWN